LLSKTPHNKLTNLQFSTGKGYCRVAALKYRYETEPKAASHHAVWKGQL
jgi:hypothetical protein